MSHTFTSRPSVARTRGRGRGGTERGKGRGRGASGGITSTESENEASPNQRMERRDGYTMIPPNEKKREKVAQQAKAEEDSYKKYREARTQKTFSYIGTVGGDSETPEKPKPSLASPNKPFGAKTQYKESLKRQEEEEIKKKKEAARQKAESNSAKEAERNKKLDEDRKMKMAAFLAKIDTNKKKSSSSAMSVNLTEREEHMCEGASAAAEASSGEYSEQLAILTETYPEIAASSDPEVLRDILQGVDGDLDQAIKLLTS